jgi:hypothetical protein
MLMLVARTILAVLIAISIAVVPATGGMVRSAKPVEMSMANLADMPCCPAPGDSKGSLACGFNCCLNFVVAMFPPTIVLAHIADGVTATPVDAELRGHVSPPAHPPPI